MNIKFPTNIRIAKTIREIRRTLGLSLSEFITLFDMSEKEYFKHELENFKNLKILHLDRLCTRLNIDIENVAVGKIDMKMLKQNFWINSISLPPKYLDNDSSKMLTLINAMDFINNNLGVEHSRYLLSKFQLDPSVLNDPTLGISISLIDEMYVKLGQYYFEMQDFFSLGHFSAKQYLGVDSFAEHFNIAKSLQDCYQICFDHALKYLDKNWNYSIKKLTSTNCVVSCTTKESTAEKFKTQHFGCLGLCYHKGGFMSGISNIMSNFNAEVIESKCVNRGNSECRYEINFQKSATIPFYKEVC